MSEVELKRKVTLKRKGEPSKLPDPPKSKWWMWLILTGVVVVAIFLVVKIIPFGNGGKPPTIEVAKPESSQTMNAAVGTPEPAPQSTTQSPTTPVAEPVTVNNQSNQATSSPATPSESPSATTSGTSNTQNNQSVTRPTNTSVSPQGTLDEKALRVIRGDFGNGEERKQKLGSEYLAIQQRVNEMYRSGSVY